MPHILRRLCSNFLFIFWPSLASVPQYPKYLGLDKHYPVPDPPPPDTFNILCTKLFFGALFDATQVGLVFAIISWLFTSFISAFSDILFYIKVFLCVMFVYLIMYGLAVLIGTKTMILPSSPESSRRRIWTWVTKARTIKPRAATIVKNNDAASESITEEGEIFYNELRKDLPRRKEMAAECEYQESLKEFHLNQKISEGVFIRTSVPTEHHKSSTPKSQKIPFSEEITHIYRNVSVNHDISLPDTPDYNGNMMNFARNGNHPTNICPDSEACKRKVKDGLAPHGKTATPSKKPAKKVNFEETNNDKSTKSSDKYFVAMKASQSKLRNDYDTESDKITQQEARNSKRQDMETPIAGCSKMDQPVRNRRELTPILKKRPCYLQQHREKNLTPPSGTEPEPTGLPKLYSPKINKNVKFAIPKSKTE